MKDSYLFVIRREIDDTSKQTQLSIVARPQEGNRASSKVSKGCLLCFQNITCWK